MSGSESASGGPPQRGGHDRPARTRSLPLLLAAYLFSSCGKQATGPAAPVPVASVAVAPANAAIQAGQTVQLMATTRDANGNVLTGRMVTWGSGTPALAAVSGTGLVTGIAAGGPVTITATSEGQSGTAAVTVSAIPVASVTVTPASATIQVGQTVQLTATTKDANGNVLTGRTVTWASSIPTVATANASGLVMGIAGGPVTITATSEGKSGTAAVTVTPVPVASVTVTPSSASIQQSQTGQLTATPKDANGNPLTGRTVTWSSSNTSVATVNGSGLVTGVSVGGPVTITAISEGQAGTAAITVIPVPVASVTVRPAIATIEVGQTVQLSATTRDASGNLLTGRTVTWASSAPAQATVNGSGLVTAISSGGPVAITATSEGKIGTATVTVTAPSGDLYVSTRYDGSVWHYDMTGQLVRGLVTNWGTDEVGGAAFGPDCNLYVALTNPLTASGSSSAGVAVFSGTTDAFLRWVVPSIAVASAPGPIAFGSDGSFYLAIQNPDVLLRYDTTGQLLHSYSLTFPVSYLTFHNGILYLTLAASTSVFSLDVQTGTQTKFVDMPVGFPAGITFDGGGNFYAVEVTGISANLSHVLEFPGQGGQPTEFVSINPLLNGGLGEATDLVFGGDGRLYVLSFDGNKVLRYSGTDGSFDQAFAQIPSSGVAGGPKHLGFKPLTCH